ncbi:DJ-1/PfpI family protein [Oxalobacteraceae bacterium OTU3REALA1]|nr:DJ-1/PfpI family protein [Oxalobacteraceae bacterium OTU3REALA1]
MTRTIGIYVYDDVEVPDFAGPYDVFTCATRVSNKTTPNAPPPFRVRTIGRTSALLRARAGLTVFPESDFGGGDIDVLIVPGGVIDAELARPDVIAWIAETARDSELVASVRTGAFLLTQAGLLDGQQLAADNAAAETAAIQAFPELRVQGKRRWTGNGAIIASGGVTTGIDLSLHLVERLAGRELAQATARQMDYDWS